MPADMHSLSDYFSRPVDVFPGMDWVGKVLPLELGDRGPVFSETQENLPAEVAAVFG